MNYVDAASVVAARGVLVPLGAVSVVAAVASSSGSSSAKNLACSSQNFCRA